MGAKALRSHSEAGAKKLTFDQHNRIFFRLSGIMIREEGIRNQDKGIRKRGSGLHSPDDQAGGAMSIGITLDPDSMFPDSRFSVSWNSVSRIADLVLYREKIERGRESP